MMKRGEIVYENIGKRKFSVEGLDKRNRQAMETYRKRRPTMNYTDVALLPWQDNAIDLIN